MAQQGSTQAKAFSCCSHGPVMVFQLFVKEREGLLAWFKTGAKPVTIGEPGA
jgi:hypothetical protein